MPVTSTTDQVMSFTVKTTYRKGDTSVELSSRVSDLLPKQSRPAFAGGPKLVPADPDSISVAVTSVQAAVTTTPKAEMQKKLKLSQPQPVEGSSSVTVEVTNTDEKETFTVSLASAYIHDASGGATAARDAPMRAARPRRAPRTSPTSPSGAGARRGNLARSRSPRRR